MGMAALLRNHPAFGQLFDGGGGGGAGGPAGPGGGMTGTPTGAAPGAGMGALSMLPRGHQIAAMAPPPIPGGDFDKLGPYAQQALGLAGIQPPPPPQPPGPVGPPGGSPGRIPPGIGPGKGSPFGGQIDIPGLFGRRGLMGREQLR